MPELTPPEAVRVGEIRVQDEKATPKEDRKNWYVLREEKRAHIDLEIVPEFDGKTPKARVHFGSKTVTIDCEGSPVPAGPLYTGLMTALFEYVGDRVQGLFDPVAPASEDEARLRTTDPHRLVRTFRRMREDGPIELDG